MYSLRQTLNLLPQNVALLGCLATSRAWLLKLQRRGGSVMNERMGKNSVSFLSRHYFRVSY